MDKWVAEFKSNTYKNETVSLTVFAENISDAVKSAEEILRSRISGSYKMISMDMRVEDIDKTTLKKWSAIYSDKNRVYKYGVSVVAPNANRAEELANWKFFKDKNEEDYYLVSLTEQNFDEGYIEEIEGEKK